jgi:3-deoxy-D-manno-octulosonic-acid transferase
MLQNAGAAWIVSDSDQLVNQVNSLLADKVLRYSAGEKGKKLVEDNRGSIHRIMEIIGSYLKLNTTCG